MLLSDENVISKVSPLRTGPANKGKQAPCQ